MSDEADKNPDIDAVIRKIQKLLTRTKGDKAVTEAESDTAMKIVQELMAKYNLDMATVESQGSGPEDASSVRVDERSTARARFKWQQLLAKYVAEANFCLYILRVETEKDAQGNPIEIYRHGTWDRAGATFYKKRPMHRIIGRKANVVTAKLMFEYLCQAVDDSVPPSGPGLTKFTASWKEGCAAKLCERLAERRADLMAEHDAKVKAAEEAFQADVAKRAKEAKEKAQRALGPRAPTAEETEAALKGGAFRATGMRSEAPAEEPERPEVKKDAWTPGANAEPEPEAEAPVQQTGLVLASVYDLREQELNNDLRFGWEPGTTTKKRLEKEEWERKWDEEHADDEEEEDEAAEPDAPAPVETERQRIRREAREEKEWEAQRRKWAREEEREERKALKEYRRLDHTAYKAGLKVGEKIGLDPQIKARADAKRLGGGK